jgi:hypothetical protein
MFLTMARVCDFVGHYNFYSNDKDNRSRLFEKRLNCGVFCTICVKYVEHESTQVTVICDGCGIHETLHRVTERELDQLMKKLERLQLA